MSAQVKTEPKEMNLVSSSMMLVNNPVSENASGFYGDQTAASSIAKGSTSSPDLYHGYGYENYPGTMGPFFYGTYHPYSYASSHDRVVVASNRNCSCEIKPPQQSFLHQILTGKGYKNDKLGVLNRPIIKQERDFGDYGYCYGHGYPYGYGYHVYH